MFVIFLDFLFQKFVSFTFFYLKKEIRNSDTHIQGERVRDEERERQERERDPSTQFSPHKTTSVWDRPKPGTQNSIWAFHVDGRDPGTWAII